MRYLRYMFTRIHTKVTVAGWFKNNTFIPQKFIWSAQPHAIKQVTLVSEVKDGGVHHRVYSVMVDSAVFRLDYNRSTEEWWLEEVWCD